MAAVAVTMSSCFGGGKGQQQVTVEENDSVADYIPRDQTIYGLCGNGTAMNTLQLLTDNGDTLTIHAERHSEAEQKEHKDKYLRVERSYGAYSRAFDVSLIDTANIKAKYEDGVLKLTLPKKQKTEPDKRTLEIE